MNDASTNEYRAADLARLRRYGQAVRKMHAGQFHALSAPSSSDDPIDALGREVAELANCLERRFQKFQMLQELSYKASTALFADDVFNRFFDTFSTLIPYDRIGCALLTENGTKLRAHWARSQYTRILVRKGYTEKLAGSSLIDILETGMPRIINDLEAYLTAHPRSKSTRMIVSEGVRSSLTCPLIANGKPLGFLFFSSCQKNTYRDLHTTVFLKIAGQISVLIEKSLLYRELFDLNKRLNEAHEELQRQAMRDALTGILNRGAIFGALDSVLDKQRQVSAGTAVIMADLDHFKSVNDTHGHLAGDAVLRATARSIEEVVAEVAGEKGKVGRYGGEEFLVVLQESAPMPACRLAEKLRSAVSELQVDHEGASIGLTLSLGIAVSRGQDAPASLVAKADDALYIAKETGRNRTHLAQG